MHIDIFSDTICPWCYIGKRRLEEALAERPDIHPVITWHPFELNPDMPAEGVDRDDYMAMKFGDRDRAEKIYGPIREAGEALGIPFAFEKRTRIPNTARSHTVIFWAQQMGLGDAMVEALFQAYFINGRDIGDHDVLTDVAAAVGLDPDLVSARLDADYDLEAIRAVSNRGRQMGLSGVPCFIINRKFALVGAQPSEVFLDLFVKAEAEHEGV